MWGLFAGEARKQPPHIPFSTAISKDPRIIPEVWFANIKKVFKKTSRNFASSKGYRPAVCLPLTRWVAKFAT